jgi:ATPase subunit of ABC transporter with duplicated ATPase domains
MRQDAIDRAGGTVVDLLGVRPALDLIVRAAAGCADADELTDADWTLPARMEATLLRFGLSVELETPLATLSGGQRSRAALAALILADPDFLLLDEPTNNLDRAGRWAVVDLVCGWNGGAIVASHDRALLEEMDAMVELTSLGATRYGGNYGRFRSLKQAGLEAARRDLAHAEKNRIEAARRARQAVERKARKDAGHRARSLHANFLGLDPLADARAAHAALARFGFRASDALRRAGELSGGERVRAGLAAHWGPRRPRCSCSSTSRPTISIWRGSRRWRPRWPLMTGRSW